MMRKMRKMRKMMRKMRRGMIRVLGDALQVPFLLSFV
jgi:hypothetical protein